MQFFSILLLSDQNVGNCSKFSPSVGDILRDQKSLSCSKLDSTYSILVLSDLNIGSCSKFSRSVG